MSQTGVVFLLLILFSGCESTSTQDPSATVRTMKVAEFMSGRMQLSPGWQQKIIEGVDSHMGRISSADGIELEYDEGPMAGEYIRPGAGVRETLGDSKLWYVVERGLLRSKLRATIRSPTGMGPLNLSGDMWNGDIERVLSVLRTFTPLDSTGAKRWERWQEIEAIREQQEK